MYTKIFPLFFFSFLIPLSSSSNNNNNNTLYRLRAFVVPGTHGPLTPESLAAEVESKRTNSPICTSTLDRLKPFVVPGVTGPVAPAMAHEMQISAIMGQQQQQQQQQQMVEMKEFSPSSQVSSSCC